MRMARTRCGRAAVAAVAFVAVVHLVSFSSAAWTANAVNSGNALTTGTVTVASTAGTNLFTVTGARPDAAATTLSPPGVGGITTTVSTGSTCVKVTYGGSLPATVRLYATLSNTGADGGLGGHLLFAIDTGTVSSGTGCTNFTSTGYLYGAAGNLYLNGVPGSYAGGLGGWTNAVQNDTRWYRFSWLLPANAASAAQAEQVQATFVWEAQNN